MIQPSLDRFARALRSVHPLDWLLLVLALIFASFTLGFPYGRDQGLYHYVGREWFHGLLPYRDAMDQKTPVIYFLFGLANSVLGEHLWSIRVFEWLWVVGVGWALGTSAAPRGQTHVPGVRGAGSMLACVLYFGLLGFWDTAQCEIWYSGFTFLGLMVVERSERPRAGPIWAGVWTGLACLSKPPAVFLGLTVAFALLSQALLNREGEHAGLGVRAKRAGLSLGWFVMGAAIPTLLTLGYFFARGGLSDLYDVVVRCNAYYRAHEVPPADFDKVVENVVWAFRHAYPLSMFSLSLTLIGLWSAARLRSFRLARRYLVPLFLALGCVASVAVQGMYFLYHWAALHVCWSVALVLAIQDIGTYLAGPLAQPRASGWVSAAVVWLSLVGYAASGAPPHGQWDICKFSLDYLTGKIDKKTFDAHWNIPSFYDWTSNVRIGEWLREHSKPEDLVASRNFEPAIYAIAHRSSGLRFFWTAWIAWGNRAYRREDWAPQDVEQVKAHPPRFVVVYADAVAGTDSIQYFWPYGTWVERMRASGMAVFERISDTPTRPGA